MYVGLSITLSQDIQVSNFACSPIVGTIDDDVTSGESKWSGLLLLKREKYKKKYLTHKIHCNNWNKIHFLSRPNSKILRGDGGCWDVVLGINIFSLIILFC